MPRVCPACPKEVADAAVCPFCSTLMEERSKLQPDMSNDYYWALECTFGRCPKCNYLATLRVGLDARMHDKVRFRCPKCNEENVVTIVMRGAWPSPAYGPDPIPAELVE